MPSNGDISLGNWIWTWLGLLEGTKFLRPKKRNQNQNKNRESVKALLEVFQLVEFLWFQHSEEKMYVYQGFQYLIYWEE